MKTTSIIFSAIIIIAHIDSLSAQNFLPLKIGNKIQYYYEYGYHGPGGTYYGSYYPKYVVSEDSLFNDETYYKISPNPGLFHNPNEENFLFRNDSIKQKLYVKLPGDSTIRLAVDFYAPADSSFISYIIGQPMQATSVGIGVDTLFGQTVQTFEMTYNTANPYQYGNYIFAEEFGIIKHFHYWSLGTQWSHGDYDIVSAIIDTRIYNPLTLEVTGLSPLIDRPIDTFPFVLNGSYSASIPKLVDSFYVSIIQTRADSIIRSWVMEFESGLAFVPIYSSMLQVGDKIKVRAKATDESIFENVAYYPDTGYAIITVLPSTVGIKTEEEKFIYMLGQNYPNPFNPITTIIYEVPNSNFVTLKIYNTLSEEITTLVNEEKSAGSYRVEFNGNDLPSGIYFYRLTSGGYSQSRKMLLIK